MSQYFFNKKRVQLLRQATHVDYSGNLYKYVNGVLFKYKDSPYCFDITFPCWSKVDDEKSIRLTERWQ